MKIQILSDIHCEFENFVPRDSGADLLIVAGDLNTGTKGVKWIKNYFPEIPVVYIAGNHEFYHHAFPKLINDIRKETKGTNIHFLENDIFIFNNVAFMGCTLWSDFKLFGDNSHYAELAASELMTDYKVIRFSPNFRLLRTMDTAKKHLQSVDWFRTEAMFNNMNKIVITHHAPSIHSLSPEFREDLVSAAYASNLEYLIEELDPLLWIHGHTHRCVDYRIANTRIISNQKGYPDEPADGFNASFVIEI
ncbi:MAG: metallophosphoesterase [Ignavibacteriaceae bacterium]|nr:metallophosphoesterase [Ignavibacteriaceae bacterium]